MRDDDRTSDEPRASEPSLPTTANEVLGMAALATAGAANAATHAMPASAKRSRFRATFIRALPSEVIRTSAISRQIVLFMQGGAFPPTVTQGGEQQGQEQRRCQQRRDHDPLGGGLEQPRDPDPRVPVD